MRDVDMVIVGTAIGITVIILAVLAWDMWSDK